MSQKGIGPDVSSIEAISLFPFPQTVRDVKHLLSLASYYRRFCKDFAYISFPLTYLTSGPIKSSKLKNCKIHWSRECQIAFEKCTGKCWCFGFPEFLYPSFLKTDGSLKGYGANLSQKIDRKVIVTLYKSKMIKPVMRKNSSFKLEFKAMH